MKRNLGILKCMSKTLPTESLCLLYKALIEPNIRYCSIVWGNCGETLKDKLQILQKQGCKDYHKNNIWHWQSFCITQTVEMAPGNGSMLEAL